MGQDGQVLRAGSGLGKYFYRDHVGCLLIDSSEKLECLPNRAKPNGHKVKGGVAHCWPVFKVQEWGGNQGEAGLDAGSNARAVRAASSWPLVTCTTVLPASMLPAPHIFH